MSVGRGLQGLKRLRREGKAKGEKRKLEIGKA